MSRMRGSPLFPVAGKSTELSTSALELTRICCAASASLHHGQKTSEGWGREYEAFWFAEEGMQEIDSKEREAVVGISGNCPRWRGGGQREKQWSGGGVIWEILDVRMTSVASQPLAPHSHNYPPSAIYVHSCRSWAARGTYHPTLGKADGFRSALPDHGSRETCIAE